MNWTHNTTDLTREFENHNDYGLLQKRLVYLNKDIAFYSAKPANKSYPDTEIL